MPLRALGVKRHLLTNTPVLRELDGTAIGTPDLLLQIEGRDRLAHPLWIMEVAFAQKGEEAMDKMQAQLDAQSDIIACTLFNIEETVAFSSPPAESAAATTLSDGYLPSIDEITSSDNCDLWLKPLHVTMTTWVRPLDSEDPFNLEEGLRGAGCMVVVGCCFCLVASLLNFTTLTGISS